MLQAAPAFGSTFESRARGSSPDLEPQYAAWRALPQISPRVTTPSMPRVRPNEPGGSHDTRQAHKTLAALHREGSDVLPELRGEPRGTCKKNKVGEHLGIGCRNCFDRTRSSRGQAKQKTRNKCLRRTYGWPGEVPEVCVVATPAACPPAAAPGATAGSETEKSHCVCFHRNRNWCYRNFVFAGCLGIARRISP